MSATLEVPYYAYRVGLDMRDPPPQQAAKVVYSNFPTPNPCVTDRVDQQIKARPYFVFDNFLTTQQQSQVHTARARTREMIMKKELLQQVPFSVQILQDKLKPVLNTYLGVGHDNVPYIGPKGFNYLETFGQIPRILQPRMANPRNVVIVGGLVLLALWMRRR